MKEAIANAGVFNLIIIFVIILLAFFIGSLGYSKAFKVKNKIVDTIEYNDGDITSSVISEIDSKLGEIGYRVDKNNGCRTDGRFSNGTLINGNNNSGYRYCIYEFSTNKGNYYGVVAYAYLQIPIIGVNLDFPVYGETMTFTNFE